MPSPNSVPYARKYDLSNCDAEPVHLIRHYQRVALLLVVEAVEYRIVAHSDNFPFPVNSDDDTAGVGSTLEQILEADYFAEFKQEITDEYAENLNVIHVSLLCGPGLVPQDHNLIIKRSGSYFLLEFEPRDADVSTINFSRKVDLALHRIQADGDESELYGLVVANVRELTGYDRVMLYRFDEEFNGEVIAEAKEDSLTAFLHLRYPHTDIPRQARELFLRNGVRQIVNTKPEGVSSIVFEPGLRELDLTHSVNRGSSPIHLEYLRNMGVGATLTVAVVVDRKLWGLISCHHRTAKLVDYRLRSMIALIGKVLSGHLALHQAAAYQNQISLTKRIRSRLFDRMSTDFDIVGGLTNDPEQGLLRLVGATGAATYFEGIYHTLGDCPQEKELAVFLERAAEMEGNVYATDTLFEQVPAAAEFSTAPAGMMVMRFSRSPLECIFWFRPEVVKTIQWGGNPDQRKYLDGDRVRLHPNLSFQKWEQNLAGISEPWEIHQQDTAINLRNDIKEVILRKYQEVRQLNGQLVDAYQEMESFSYTVSHDLKAPLRHIKGFAEILREDYYDDMSEDGQLAVDTILSSVGRMSRFINDIMSFSRTGHTELSFSRIDLAFLTREIWDKLVRFEEKEIQLTLDPDQPVLEGDRLLIEQLILNLLSNAIKYSKRQEKPAVTIKIGQANGETFYEITDNGIGIDMKHADRIFDAFNRLVSVDQFEGTGVGLATAKRIVDKHNGRISVHSSPGEGSTFSVHLPTEQISDGVN